MTAIRAATSQRVNTFLSALATGFLTLGMVLPASSQVTSDGTSNTTVNPNGNNFTILNGIEKGSNLFHSFSNFSVPKGGLATFDLVNTPNINTIFSRVTGGNISNIDGLIQTTNTNNPVSLFLMNPAGIVFGQNAKLDIGGSFVGTTGNSIKFADGVEFSATNITAKPLLTMSVPSGLQFGQNSGSIRVEGKGHNLSLPNSSVPLQGAENISGGLQVHLGNTLALVGGDITLNGSILAAKSGRVEIGSVAQGEVNLTPTAFGWTLSYPSQQSSLGNYGKILMSSAALVDASGEGSKGIQLVGRQITMIGGSLALIKTQGTSPAAKISVSASESVELSGTTTKKGAAVSSGLKTETLVAGMGGDIAISTPSFRATGGGKTDAFAFGQAMGGNITVEAPNFVELTGASPLSPLLRSGIEARAFGFGRAGDVTLSTTNLKLAGGAILGSGTDSAGNGGNVFVRAADLIEVTGFNSIAPSSSAIRSVITSATRGSGSGGDLRLETSKLIIREGGRVTAGVLASGSGGNLMIDASESIEVSGFIDGQPNLPSTLISGADANIPIQKLLGLPPIPSGSSGSVTLNTPRLTVSNLAQVGVENQGSGNAGDINITARDIFLNRGGHITASTVSGNGGNIQLQVRDMLRLRNGSQILAEAKSSGNGGNLTIDAPIIIGLENSNIIANAVKGQGGNIAINTQGIFGLKFRPQLTTENDITASSQFGVNGTVEIKNFGVDPNSGLVELPENVTDPSQQIASSCSTNQGSSFVATGRGGIPQNPNQQVMSARTWSDIRDLYAYRKAKEEVTAQIPQSSETLIQATSWHRNSQGKIELIADKTPAQMRSSLTCAAVPNS